jgi:hypothetical protein
MISSKDSPASCFAARQFPTNTLGGVSARQLFCLSSMLILFMILGNDSLSCHPTPSNVGFISKTNQIHLAN